MYQTKELRKPTIEMKKNLVAVFLLSLSWQIGITQSIWPGDVNNNGTVNGIDLLYWGWAFGAQGPPRMTSATDWQAYPAPSLWSQTFPDGINYYFADCNGDGLVNEVDFEDAIEENYREVNGPILPDNYLNAQEGQIAPRIRLQTSTPVVMPGASVNIDLSLEGVPNGSDHFYGIAFTLKYNNELLEEDDGPDFELTENNWIEADNSNVEELYIDNDGRGDAMLAITRTNQTSIPIQSTSIGNFSVVIQDIILSLDRDTFTLEIENVRLISDRFQSIPAFTDKIQIIVTNDTSSVVVSTDEVLSKLEDQIQVFPNPATDNVFIDSPEEVHSIQLLDQVGQVTSVLFQAYDNRQLGFSTNGLASGVYYLRMKFQKHLITKKLIIVK